MAQRSDGGRADARRTSARCTASTPTCSCHPRAGHLTVMPIARMPDVPHVRGRLIVDGRRLRRAAARGRSSLAPLVGSTPISLARVFDRSIPFADNVDAQIFFVARLPRVLAAALVGGALAAGRRRLSGAAAQPAGDARHARRLERRGARRDAGDHLPLRFRARRPVVGPAGQLRRLARRARRSSTRWRRRGGAACRRRCCCWPASR